MGGGKDWCVGRPQSWIDVDLGCVPGTSSMKALEVFLLCSKGQGL